MIILFKVVLTKNLGEVNCRNKAQNFTFQNVELVVAPFLAIINPIVMRSNLVMITMLSPCARHFKAISSAKDRNTCTSSTGSSKKNLNVICPTNN